jgi:hypothetical protein
MSRTSVPLVPFLALLAALAPAPVSLAQRAVEDLLPASSYGCIRFGGLAECRKAVDQMPMAELVRGMVQKLPAETYEENIGSGLEFAANQVQRRLQGLGMRPAAVRAVLQRPMVLGIGRLTVRGHGPSVALVLDVGPAKADLDELLAAAEARFEAGREHAAGLEVRTVQLPGGPKLYAGMVGGHFVLTNSTPYLGEIAQVAGGKARGFGEASTLGSVRRHLPQPALASGYMHVRPFAAALEPPRCTWGSPDRARAC